MNMAQSRDVQHYFAAMSEASVDTRLKALSPETQHAIINYGYLVTEKPH